MPLVWAHAEYLKLVRSLRDGEIYDMPPYARDRYVRDGTGSSLTPWRFNHKVRDMQGDGMLRIEVLAPATVRWSADGWATVHDTPTRDTGLGVHVVDVEPGAGETVRFTFRWTGDGRWEGTDFQVRVLGS
jgi:glucoamylase